ncbi:sodium-dependent transporter [Catenovulum maritimum]|uniref:Transporter n=1 Tax=Catenovulum maritimum TaxID=1513271 RepID=A0A0J8H036_9ALTE|nr:sodium-dependent transporter [Catenovulum maritimum]KMT66368.1 transporter [Catenovulum maritimum]
MSQSELTESHQLWSSRFAYILAATGAAVGLGNIWKFPYIMGENGGGAFVLVYLLCIVLIGIPVMIAEVYIGKRGRKSPLRAVAEVARQSNARPFWQVVGGLGVVAGFLILSFYAVIAGWASAYVFKSAAGTFNAAEPEFLSEIFNDLVSSPKQLILWTSAVLVATTITVANGLQKGLEKAISVMMPVMLTLLVIIAIYAAILGDFSSAFHFMFSPDFSKLTIESVLVALGHAFFSLSLASGIMIMYGAYLPKNTSIVKTSIWIAIADTLVALLAGITIFPIVFANNLEPGAGPGLIFQTLPLAFGQMPGGQLFGTLFFVMLVFAAFTSAIALIESSVAWLVEKMGFNRPLAAVCCGCLLWCLSLLTIYSFAGAQWAQLNLFGLEKSLFDWLDYLTANLMLPIGGLLICIFAAWVVKAEAFKSELKVSDKVFSIIQFLLRWLAPAMIIIVFLNLIDVL